MADKTDLCVPNTENAELFACGNLLEIPVFFAYVIGIDQKIPITVQIFYSVYVVFVKKSCHFVVLNSLHELPIGNIVTTFIIPLFGYSCQDRIGIFGNFYTYVEVLQRKVRRLSERCPLTADFVLTKMFAGKKEKRQKSNRSRAVML